MSTAQALSPVSVRQHARTLLRNARRQMQHWFGDDIDGLTRSMLLEETRLPRMISLSLVTLSTATFLFILWAAFTPIKELARTEGQVVPSGYTQLVQHLEGGLVREILVQEGDFVQKDQALLRIDGAGTEEDFREQDALVRSLALQVERLQSYLQDRPADFSRSGARDFEITEQQRMLESMRTSRTSERSVLEEQIGQREQMITRLQRALGTASANLGVARESRQIYAGLYKKGLTSKTLYLQREGEFNTRQGDVNSLAQQIEEGKSELSEYRHRLETLTAQQRDSAYNELHKAESDINRAREGLKKRNDKVGRLELRAPVMGYVKGLKLNTIGAVIPAGQTVMEIVPVDEQLMVEVRIPPQQVGRIAPGQEVQVKVDSYDYVRFGTITGKLESISAMTFTDENLREDYYKGRIKLARNFAGGMPDSHPIIPGMTVDADIVVGEKSVLRYLLKPIQTAMYNALTEQ